MIKVPTTEEILEAFKSDINKALVDQSRAKDKWINQLLDAHEEMKKLLLENGILMPEDVKNADTPP